MTFFAPYDDVPTALVNLARSATSSILIDIYGFTYTPLMDALIAQHQAGLSVRCVCDHTQAAGPAEKVQLQRLVDAGIEVTIGTSIHGAIDHSKYIIVDGDKGAMDPASCVGYGSFNFSASAEQQDNTFTIRNDAGYVAHFMANWQRVHDDAIAHGKPEWQILPTNSQTGVAASASLPTSPAQG